MNRSVSHWTPDEEKTSCHNCHQPFNLVTCRRHHCRRCGQIFCGDCCNIRARLPESYGFGTEKVRLCEECLRRTTEGDSSHLAEELDVRDEINQCLKHALSQKSRILERCHVFLLTIESSFHVGHRPPCLRQSEPSSTRLTDSDSRASLDEEADDDSDEMEALLRRCEDAFKTFLAQREHQQACLHMAEQRVSALETTLAVKARTLEQLQHNARSLQQELTQLQCRAVDQETADTLSANQNLLLKEKDAAIQKLRLRCHALEKRVFQSSDADLPPTSSSTLSRLPHLIPKSRHGKQQRHTALPESWGSNAIFSSSSFTLTAGEPLLQELSSGAPVPGHRGRGHDGRRPFGHSLLSTSPRLSICERFLSLWCCCKRRRQRNSPRTDEEPDSDQEPTTEGLSAVLPEHTSETVIP